MDLIEKVINDRVDKAVEVIKGYCSKHSDCYHDCRFYDKYENECVFEKGKIPCNWGDNNA
jgi:hypothetical protein